MGEKKKKAASKKWTSAGEPVYAAHLSPSEEQTFKESFFWLREASARAREEAPHLSRSASAMKRSEEAAKASIGYFFQRFEGKYPRTVIVDALVKAVALPGPVEDHYDGSTSYMLGAALWVLDYAKHHQLGHELLELLPSELDEDTDFATPDVDDLTHGRDDILGLMTIFMRRKKDQRQAFRKLWSLVDRETASALRGAFQDALLDYFDRYLEVCFRVSPSADTNKGETSLPFDNLLPGMSSFRGMPDDPLTETPPKEHPDLWFLMNTPLLVGTSPDRIRESLYYRRASDLMEGFRVEEPYAVCAAYLLLERDGDLLAALNMLTVNVLVCAERHLPWGIGGDYSYAEPFSDGTAEHALQYTYHPHENAEEEELPDPDIEPGERLSEHQLFYLATGYALPRNQVPSERLRNWFMEQGLPEIRAEALAWGAWFASYIDDLRAFGNPAHLEESLQSLEDEWTEAEEDEEEDVDSSEVVDSAAQIAELTRKLKASRQALHEAEQNARQLQKRLQSSEAGTLRDRAELSQLRETLFELRTKEGQPESKTEPEIEFPYQTKRRIVSFGGHDTWRKAIRPMLPDVRFFDRELLPDVNTVKGADVVWIQTNAIPHKTYYRIIDVARKVDVPVRYFGTASARKCAEQVVMEELAAEES